MQLESGEGVEDAERGQKLKEQWPLDLRVRYFGLKLKRGQRTTLGRNNDVIRAEYKQQQHEETVCSADAVTRGKIVGC